MRRPRRRHDDIDIHRLLQCALERDGLAAELRGQLLCLLDVAVGHVNLAHAVRDEVLRRKFRHLARAEDQRIRSRKQAELFLREFDCRIAYRDRVVGDACLRAHALARRDGAVEESVEHRARRARLARDRVRLLDLREDLALAEHERIKARGHVEEVADAFLVDERVEVSVDVLVVARQVEQELLERRDIFLRIIDDGVHLAAVAGREHDGLRYPLVFIEIFQTIADRLPGNREVLAHLHRCRLMI